ncbi:MAG: discoidin domain-containing protein, partial [Fibrobacter sp.]|nr:discoidin domain-containing protein [Fibrobacter sp.]
GFTGSFEVIVDLGKAQDLHDFTMTFIQDCGPGVYFPGNVTVETSLDGTNYSAPVVISHDFPSDKQGVYVKDFTTPLTTKARYLRVNAANVTGGFIFADEIVIH